MAPVPEERLGFLRSCLVEGDSAQEMRVRRNKQRALLISIVFQILIVAALVVFPLLSKGENIASRVIISPLPPYARGSSHPHKPATPHTPPQNRPACHFCEPDHIPQGIVTRDPSRAATNSDDVTDDSDISRFGDPFGDPNGLLNSDSKRGPKPPSDPLKPVTQTTARRQVSEPLQAALLFHRVEPSYPPLAIQLRHEGRVELRALIGTDGSIQSLEVISGDPLFIKSAVDAVREWQYHPTLLNGQPIQVETRITVIYTLSH